MTALLGCAKSVDVPISPAPIATPELPALATSDTVATNTPQPVLPPIKGARDADGYFDLDWLEMMPADDLAALKNPPPLNHAGTLRAQQGGSFKVIAALDGVKVKLPGYVVPLETDDKGRMTEFFFVPFFGACIHVPPPPPNQLIYVHLKTAMKQPEIWDPYWLKGVLNAKRVSNETAASAYTMDAATLVPYQ